MFGWVIAAVLLILIFSNLKQKLEKIFVIMPNQSRFKEYMILLQTYSIEDQIEDINKMITFLSNSKKHVSNIIYNRYERIKHLTYLRENIKIKLHS